MTNLVFDGKLLNREVAFCRVYGMESKKKIEKLFLNNRISYFIEWQERSFLTRLFGDNGQKDKNMFTVRINEADLEKATALVQGLESVKIRKQREE